MSQKKSKRKATGVPAALPTDRDSDSPPGFGASRSERERPGHKPPGQSNGADDRSARHDAFPSTGVRAGLSIWVCFHLTALFLSFTSVVEPSTIHARLAAVVHPYLTVAHFGADDRPVYLAHGLASEQPHQLQVTEEDLTDLREMENCQWRTLGAEDLTAGDASRGLAVSDRLARWLSTAATLAENDQPGVVAELLMPVAREFEDARAIRLVRLPTDLSDVNARDETPYAARVVRDDERVWLIKLNPERLSAHAVAGSEEASNE
jgi:hypothetical protein